jgi:hypothetical protein
VQRSVDRGEDPDTSVTYTGPDAHRFRTGELPAHPIVAPPDVCIWHHLDKPVPTPAGGVESLVLFDSKRWAS